MLSSWLPTHMEFSKKLHPLALNVACTPFLAAIRSVSSGAIFISRISMGIYANSLLLTWHRA